MKVPFLDLKPQHEKIKKEVFEKIEELYDRTEFAFGKTGKDFERIFAAYNQSVFACAVDNGTSAVEICLRAAGIGQGDEVITVANTFIATVAGIHFTGATPVFAEIDPDTWNMNSRSLEEKITSRTKAVLPVHLYGQPADMPAIREIAKKNKLIIIADAAQSIGSKILEDGTWSSSSVFADASSFSFYAGKNLGACGEAGMIVTDRPGYVDFIEKFRDHGMKIKYIHELIGRNNRMDSFQAAILSIKLKYIEGWNEKRRQIAQWYKDALKDVEEIKLQHIPDHILPVYHLMVALVENRQDFQNYLSEKEIGTALHYKLPVHLQEAFSGLGYRKGDLPVTESVVERNVSLPMYPELTFEQIQYVTDVIKDYFTKRK